MPAHRCLLLLSWCRAFRCDFPSFETRSCCLFLPLTLPLPPRFVFLPCPLFWATTTSSALPTACILPPYHHPHWTADCSVSVVICVVYQIYIPPFALLPNFRRWGRTVVLLFVVFSQVPATHYVHFWDRYLPTTGGGFPAIYCGLLRSIPEPADSAFQTYYRSRPTP